MERLAIEGGRPVRNKLLPYGRQWIDEDDIAAVVEVLKGDWLTQGPKVEEFERSVADYCGSKYAVAVANGTAALHAACAVAGITHGDEAIITPLTFAATANAVVYCGGTPVFADIQEDTLNIDPEEVIKRITSKTKAILPVDFAGRPSDIGRLMMIAKNEGLIVIEDACHALGSEYKGKKIGSLSDMTVLSFHPVKHITTGEGGMILTNRKGYYEDLRAFRHHGIMKTDNVLKTKGPWYYEICNPGHNFRITDFQCALGISQLKKIDFFIRRRREIAAQYNEAFQDEEAIIIPAETANAISAYHLYVIQLRTDKLRVTRREVFEALRAENIGVNVHYLPVHLHPFYQKQFGYRIGDYPKAEGYYERAMTLPIFPKMNDNDVNDVVFALRKVIGAYLK